MQINNGKKTSKLKVGLWFPGFLISSCLMFILCILMFTFPEKLKKSTLTFKEKRILRKKKLLSQSATSTTSVVSQVESNANFIRNHPLPTINESSENVDDDANNANFDSISNKLASSSNKIFSIADSVSSNFSSVATHSATTLSYNESEKSLKEIESVNQIFKPSKKNQKETCLADKLNITKLKVIGIKG